MPSLRDIHERQNQDDQPWIIENVIPKDGLVVFGGRQGTWKTTLACLTAHAALDGHPLLDEWNTTNPVDETLFVNGDMSATQLHDYFYERIGVDNETAERIEVMEDIQLDKGATSDKVEPMMRWVGQANDPLVVIDSLSSCTTTDFEENAANSVKPVMQTLRQLTKQMGCTTIFIHHTRKQAQGHGLEQLRGSSTIADAVDAGFIFEQSDDVTLGRDLVNVWPTMKRQNSNIEPWTMVEDEDDVLTVIEGENTMQEATKRLVATVEDKGAEGATIEEIVEKSHQRYSPKSAVELAKYAARADKIAWGPADNEETRYKLYAPEYRPGDIEADINLDVDIDELDEGDVDKAIRLTSDERDN